MMRDQSANKRCDGRTLTNGAPWFVIHVLAREDIFNKQESQRKIRADGTPSRIWKRLVLDANRVSEGVLFRVKGLSLGIYSTDRPDSFKSVVKRLGLTGLQYQELFRHP